MSLTITEGLMQSDLTDHSAVKVDGEWRVSWLPGKTLDRNQALTAMTIAEEVSRAAQVNTNVANMGLIASLARELDLLCVEAVQMVMDNQPE